MDAAKDDWVDRWEAGARTFYLAEITRQSTYGLAALAEAVRSARRRPIEASPWLHVQTFLSATANVSKLLWPAKGRSKEPGRDVAWRTFRGSQLRQKLGVLDDSALKDKKVRNAAEHFDERMDGPLRDQRLPELWSDFTQDSFQRLPLPFRAIDVGRSEVIVADDRLHYPPIADELTTLAQRCHEIAPGLADEADVVYMMAMLRWPPMPSLFDSSERPDEPVTTGVDLERGMPPTLEAIIAAARKLIHSPRV